MITEQVAVGGTDGRALGDVLDGIISSAKLPGEQAPSVVATPPAVEAGTSPTPVVETPAPTPLELTEAPPPPAEKPVDLEPIGNVGETGKVKIKILPDTFYEVAGEDGSTREMDGKTLLGEMMLRSEFNRKTNDVKKIEEEAKTKVAEAERISHWVNTVAGNKFLTLATQAIDKGVSEQDAIKYAAAVTGIDLASLGVPQAPVAPAVEDPRAKILDGVESDDPAYTDKLAAFMTYQSEQAENRAYNRIKAEQSAKELQASEAQKVADLKAAEEKKQTDAITAHNAASINSVNTYLSQRFGEDFAKLSSEEKKPIYDTITDFLATEGINLRSKEYLEKNIVTERDIKYGVGFAFPSDFSLKPKVAPGSTAPQPPAPGMITPDKMPLNAGGQSHGIPPVETRQEPTSSEVLTKTLDDIIAHSKPI